MRKTNEETKETSKWVLGGDGITDIVIPKENLERVKKMLEEERTKELQK